MEVAPYLWLMWSANPQVGDDRISSIADITPGPRLTSTGRSYHAVHDVGDFPARVG